MPLAPEIKKAGHTADPVPDPQASRPFGSTGPAPEAGPQARPDPAPAKPVQPEPAGGRVPMPVPPAPAPAPAPAPRSEQPRTEALLGDIRQQLQDLNRNMARLEQTVQNAAAAPRLDPVLERIDAARTRLEGMLSAGTRQAEPQADPDLGDKLQKMQELLESIGARQERNDRQLSQCLRENANFQVQVRQGMQRDMEKMRSQLDGSIFNSLLKEIATVYVEYGQMLLKDASIQGTARKNLMMMFSQLEDLLTDYDAEVQQSEVGEVRKGRSTKVIEKVPTGDQTLHNTVALSRRPGVVKDRIVLYPEYVDVYVYDPNLPAPVEEPAQPEPTPEPQPQPETTAAPDQTEMTGQAPAPVGGSPETTPAPENIPPEPEQPDQSRTNADSGAQGQMEAPGNG